MHPRLDKGESYLFKSSFKIFKEKHPISYFVTIFSEIIEDTLIVFRLSSQNK